MLDVVMAKPKPMLHVVGRRELPLRLVVCWSRGAMFASSHFGIAQSGWQPYNVPLRIRVINLQHRFDICHTMPYIMQWLLYACFSCPSVWARNGVINFVRSTWVIFGTRWQVQFPFGGTKQLCALHVTIMGVKTCCSWIRLYVLCHWLWISTLGNSLKLQWCWIMAFTSGPPFNHDL